MGKVDDPSSAFHSGQGKARSALDEMSGTGEFKRTDSTYRDHIKKGTRFEPEGKPRLLCVCILIIACCAGARLACACLVEACLVEHASAQTLFCLCVQLGGITCTLPMPVHGPADAWQSET